jgi:predicted metal-dependent hydrolase
MALQNPDETFIDPSQFQLACTGQLHPSAQKGVELFNKRKYWEAHEALEQAWLEETGPSRHLYKGILQAGVTYLQIERRNFIGMAKMYERCRKWLAPWPEVCRGIKIGQLRKDVALIILAAGELGPDRLDKIDQVLFRPLVLNKE